MNRGSNRVVTVNRHPPTQPRDFRPRSPRGTGDSPLCGKASTNPLPVNSRPDTTAVPPAPMSIGPIEPPGPARAPALRPVAPALAVSQGASLRSGPLPDAAAALPPGRGPVPSRSMPLPRRSHVTRRRIHPGHPPRPPPPWTCPGQAPTRPPGRRPGCGPASPPDRWGASTNAPGVGRCAGLSQPLPRLQTHPTQPISFAVETQRPQDSGRRRAPGRTPRGPRHRLPGRFARSAGLESWLPAAPSPGRGPVAAARCAPGPVGRHAGPVSPTRRRAGPGTPGPGREGQRQRMAGPGAAAPPCAGPCPPGLRGPQ